MGKTRYCIKTNEIYSRQQIEDIITIQCQKKKYPVPPSYSHGRVSGIAHDLGIEPKGKDGRSFTYLGTDVIKIIDKALEKQAKEKGEPKQRTKTSPSTKPMAKPSQISIDDISRNTKYDQIIDKLWDCIGILESMKEK